MAFFTNGIAIDPGLAKAIGDCLTTSNNVRRAAETRRKLTNDPPFLTLPDLDPFLRPTNAELQKITRQLSAQTNLAVGFAALLGLTA